MTVSSARSRIRQALSTIVPSIDPAHFANSLADKSPAEIFPAIYRSRIWGGRLSRRYHSGPGSRDAAVVGPYVAAVAQYLVELGRPSIVDLGCGDFHVGRKLLPYAATCVACDIVPDLIAFNDRKYRAANLQFRVVDAIDDDLPQAGVIVVRQVLQHLSNAQVAKISSKLKQYKAAVVTEHLPAGADFTPNKDQAAGPHTRLGLGSGVVLTAPPFNLSPRNVRHLCAVGQHGGIVSTIAYEF